MLCWLCYSSARRVSRLTFLIHNHTHQKKDKPTLNQNPASMPPRGHLFSHRKRPRSAGPESGADTRHCLPLPAAGHKVASWGGQKDTPRASRPRKAAGAGERGGGRPRQAHCLTQRLWAKRKEAILTGTGHKLPLRDAAAHIIRPPHTLCRAQLPRPAHARRAASRGRLRSLSAA